MSTPCNSRRIARLGGCTRLYQQDQAIQSPDYFKLQSLIGKRFVTTPPLTVLRLRTRRFVSTRHGLPLAVEGFGWKPSDAIYYDEIMRLPPDTVLELIGESSAPFAPGNTTVNRHGVETAAMQTSEPDSKNGAPGKTAVLGILVFFQSVALGSLVPWVLCFFRRQYRWATVSGTVMLAPAAFFFLLYFVPERWYR